MNIALQNNNYIVLRGFIEPQEAEKLAVQFEQDAINKNFVGDSQSLNSRTRYNYRHFVHLLCSKTKELSDLYQGKLLPTYSYARVYLEGGTLLPHVDRKACEVSVTLCLQKSVDWPIYIRKPDGTVVSVELEPGDAIMYRGCVAEHWRDTYVGGKHTQVFLHYVDLEGPNMPHYFDRLGAANEAA
jgi:hypothetical protein